MRYLPVLAALALLVGFGGAEGLWTHRWVPSDEIPRAVARLKTVPKTVGSWEGQDKEMDPRDMKIGEMDGCLKRLYVNNQTGQIVSVLLVCGRPGPTSLHTPEVCFEGAGYTEEGTKQHQVINVEGRDPPAEFWVARFKKEGPVPERLKTAWAWTARGPWLAPEFPRGVFASSGALFKLYVSQKLDDPQGDPSTEFLKVFLPELGKCLFPAAEAPAGKV